MKLSMHSNVEEGVVLIEFDEEGREKLLGDIEKAVAQEDHEFDVLDAEGASSSTCANAQQIRDERPKP